MPSVRQRVGAWGEDRVEQWYLDRGFVTVARNWRCGRGEIDLVVLGRGHLVVCEVKTRRTDRYGSPAEAVTHDKQRRIRRLAMALLDERPELRRHQLRFDVAGVTPAGIEVLEAAF